MPMIPNVLTCGLLYLEPRDKEIWWMVVCTGQMVQVSRVICLVLHPLIWFSWSDGRETLGFQSLTNCSFWTFVWLIVTAALEVSCCSARVCFSVRVSCSARVWCFTRLYCSSQDFILSMYPLGAMKAMAVVKTEPRKSHGTFNAADDNLFQDIAAEGKPPTLTLQFSPNVHFFAGFTIFALRVYWLKVSDVHDRYALWLAVLMGYC